jgi:Flp pilus assembly protein TadB
MAPSAHHRVLWREGVREQRLKMGNTLTIAGLVFVVPAMLGAVFVIADFIFGHTAAVVLTMALILFFALLWFALPFWYRSDGEA